MNPLVKLTGFTAVLLVAFGAAFGIGRAVGPVGDDPAPSNPAVVTTTTTAPEHGSHP